MTAYGFLAMNDSSSLRNRIASDLHDDVGSSLSSIHMLSQVAANNLLTMKIIACLLKR